MDEKELKKLTDDLNTSFEKLQKDLEKKADADVLTKNMDEISGKLGLLADKEYAEKMQKQVDQIALDIKELGTRQGKVEKSTTEQVDDFLKSDDYKGAIKSRTPFITNIKANEITTSNSFTQTAEPLIQSYRDPIIGVQPRMNLTIWNLISKGFTTSDLVSVVERTSETSGAAARTEIAAAGQSYAGWTVTNHAVRDVAEFIPVSRNKLEDTDFIRSEIMEMLDYHLPAERERQMINGLSANNELLGLVNATAPVAKVFAKPTDFEAVTSANNFDVLMAAVLQVALGNTSTTNRTGFQANGIVIRPVDATNMKLLKDNDNRYLMVPFAPTGFTIDGVPVFVSQFLPTGTSFLVGDFTRAKAYMRRDLEIRMAEQHDTNFTHNLVTFLATQRLAFVVKANVDSYAFVSGSFATAKALISA